jgi:hypothetical protein
MYNSYLQALGGNCDGFKAQRTEIRMHSLINIQLSASNIKLAGYWL